VRRAVCWEAFLLARKCKILIADDSKLLRKQLREELEALDCEVIETENGKEAITESLSDRPDGVILDIVMPEINGIEVLRVIKELDDTIPVIMLSSAGTPEKLMETLKLGALDFIQKPYTPEQIEKAIARIRKKAGLDEQ
jgi:chemotaxis protein CheY